MTKKRIFIALSGGVDSSVAAAFLRDQGHDVTGVYMKNWSSSEGLLGDCTYLRDRRDAARVAAHLGIPFREVDFEQEYRERIYRYFVESYRAGRTPNPDVLCNREIKFGLLLDYALEQGAEYLATGHYARIRSSELGARSSTEFPTPSYQLLRGKDPAKDQSYFLHRLTQDQLRYALFPLGELTKQWVRELAQQYGLPTAGKKDSQGLCFVGPIDLREFLKREIPEQEGAVVSPGGERLGRHPGAAYYTVGQRHGVGVAASEPRYIVRTDVAANTVVLGTEEALYATEVTLEDIHWIGEAPELPARLEVQIRYRATPALAVLQPDGRLIFEEPVRAPAPGQFAVFLRGEQVLGGGVINRG